MFVLQTLDDSDVPCVLTQLLSIIKPHGERDALDYNLEEILVLLVYIYSVVGELKMDETMDKAECAVKKALLQSLCDEPNLSQILQQMTGEVKFHFI